MNFKIITTFKDAIRKVPADLNQLNDKARRHWLKKKLSQNNIPFTYIGNETIKDDMKINVLAHNIFS